MGTHDNDNFDNHNVYNGGYFTKYDVGTGRSTTNYVNGGINENTAD